MPVVVVVMFWAERHHSKLAEAKSEKGLEHDNLVIGGDVISLIVLTTCLSSRSPS